MGDLAQYYQGALKELGLNYSELARLTGVSAVYVMKVVKGERIPSDAVIGKLSRALGVDPRKALFLAHRDKTPEEFRDLFRLPEPTLPAIRKKLLSLFRGEEESLRFIETDQLGLIERSVLGLFARKIADRSIADRAFRERHSITDDLLERLEWGEAYFGRLIDELISPLRQSSFCKALTEVVKWWDFTAEEDVFRVKFVDVRETEYKFCLLETGKFRRELVLDSVKSRTVEAQRDKSLGDLSILSRGPVSPGKGLSVEQCIIDRLKDETTRDFLIKAMELSAEDLEETRDIVALKLKRSSHRTRQIT